MREGYTPLMLQEIEKENTVEGWQVELINSGQSLYVLFGQRERKHGRKLQRLFTWRPGAREEFIMAVTNTMRISKRGRRLILRRTQLMTTVFWKITA